MIYDLYEQARTLIEDDSPKSPARTQTFFRL